MSAEPLSDLKSKVQYCFGGEHAVGRGIFHLPEQDPLAPPKYVSVRSQQVISTILIVLVFLVNLLAIRLAVFTNDVCEGAGRIFVGLMLLSLLTSTVMYAPSAAAAALFWRCCGACLAAEPGAAAADFARVCSCAGAYRPRSAKVGYHLGYVLAAAEYLPTEFNVDASA
jgi:hypothetical protein